MPYPMWSQLKPADIKPVPEFQGAGITDYLDGIATLPDAFAQHMLILIDIEELLSNVELEYFTQMTQ